MSIPFPVSAMNLLNRKRRWFERNGWMDVDVTSANNNNGIVDPKHDHSNYLAPRLFLTLPPLPTVRNGIGKRDGTIPARMMSSVNEDQMQKMSKKAHDNNGKQNGCKEVVARGMDMDIFELDLGITEISGEAGTGKTQLCLSLCVSCASLSHSGNDPIDDTVGTDKIQAYHGTFQKDDASSMTMASPTPQVFPPATGKPSPMPLNPYLLKAQRTNQNILYQTHQIPSERQNHKMKSTLRNPYALPKPLQNVQVPNSSKSVIHGNGNILDNNNSASKTEIGVTLAQYSSPQSISATHHAATTSSRSESPLLPNKQKQYFDSSMLTTKHVTTTTSSPKESLKQNNRSSMSPRCYYKSIYVSMGEGISQSQIAHRLSQMSEGRLKQQQLHVIKKYQNVDHHHSSVQNGESKPSVEQVLKRIFTRFIRNEEEFMDLIHKELPHTLSTAAATSTTPWNNNDDDTVGRVGLIVFDSIAGLFRVPDADCQQNKMKTFYGMRSAKLFQVSAQLKKLSEEFSVPVVIVNQVTSKISPHGVSAGDSCNDGGVIPSLGMSWSNCINSRFLLTREEVMCPVSGEENNGKKDALHNDTTERDVTISGTTSATQFARKIRVLLSPCLSSQLSTSFVIDSRGCSYVRY